MPVMATDSVDLWRRGMTTAGEAVGFLLLMFAVHVAVYWVRFDPGNEPNSFLMWQSTWPWFLGIKLLVFAGCGQLRSWWKRGSFRDAKQLVHISLAATILLMAANYMLKGACQIPRSIMLLDWLATILTIFGLRTATRSWREWDVAGWLRGSRVARAAIVGSSSAAEVLGQVIQRSSRVHYRLLGIISDTRQPNRHVGTLPTLGSIADLESLLRRHRVEELLVVGNILDGNDFRRLLHLADTHGVLVRTVPSYEELLEGRELALRQVSIEDLLRRDPVPFDDSCLQRWIEGKNVLVTGSAGSIGSEICRQVLRYKPRVLVALDRAESGQFMLEQELDRLEQVRNAHPTSGSAVSIVLADVNDAHRLRGIFAEYRPEVVFHAAAYKHVPMLERYPSEAVTNIALATQRVADLAVEFDVDTFVLISTDKAVRPACVMGACKRMAELYVQALTRQSHCQFVIVRFGNVLNSAGSVVPLFQQQIAQGGPVTVTHPEVKRYFMTIPEAAQLVLHAARIGKSGDIMALDMGEPIRIIDLARDLIRLSGLREGRDIQIQFTGLRPGEKLEEELWDADDEVLPTVHPKVLRIAGTPPDSDAIRNQFLRLRHALAGSKEELLECIRQMVPEYQRPRRSEPALRRRAA